jgi:FlaA1/EpsC-like NDP-sugar epimerase
MGSRGSVIPFFLERRKSGVLPITDPAMTRFNISLQEGVDMVLWSLEERLGRRDPGAEDSVVPHHGPGPCHRTRVRASGGRRAAGEKIHEEMITASDSFNTLDLGRYYAILPSHRPLRDRRLTTRMGGSPVAPGFSYDSGSNAEFLGVEQLRALIRRHVDPAHSP